MPFIVLVHWKIRPGMESEFEQTWRNIFKIRDASGLLGEFLSRVDAPDGQWNTWNLTAEGATTYVNVGLWRSEEDFARNVASYVSKQREFEFSFRGRAMLHSLMYRLGEFSASEWKLKDDWRLVQ